MINELLTQIDYENINSRFRNEKWKYYTFNKFEPYRYIFSNVGRCYDIIKHKFVKLYRYTNGFSWFLKDINVMEDVRYNAIEIMKTIYFNYDYIENNYKEFATTLNNAEHVLYDELNDIFTPNNKNLIDYIDLRKSDKTISCKSHLEFLYILRQDII